MTCVRAPSGHSCAMHILEGDTMSVARPGRKLLASAVVAALASFSAASLHAQEAAAPPAEEEEATTLATVLRAALASPDRVEAGVEITSAQGEATTSKVMAR